MKTVHLNGISDVEAGRKILVLRLEREVIAVCSREIYYGQNKVEEAIILSAVEYEKELRIAISMPEGDTELLIEPKGQTITYIN